MNKEVFFSMEKDKRAEAVNKLLIGRNQSEVAELIGVSQSILSKEMMKEDFTYIARENKYFKFVRSPKDAIWLKNQNNSTESLEMAFLRDNLEKLKQLVTDFEEGIVLSLDKEIYSPGAIFVNKNIRINQAVYEKFIVHCSKQFPHLKIQDLIAQSLLEFVGKYSTDLKPHS
ncbi:hypothetical protein [Planococcus sp. CAU13]|uniref:hypothetical protein n=1 Tax=Planococcus sp. CAU13 TaxID=1541197 RepID=UPI000530027B|nr:hypothetical protein [Planococcus sp. CAU13]